MVIIASFPWAYFNIKHGKFVPIQLVKPYVQLIWYSIMRTPKSERKFRDSLEVFLRIDQLKDIAVPPSKGGPGNQMVFVIVGWCLVFALVLVAVPSSFTQFCGFIVALSSSMAFIVSGIMDQLSLSMAPLLFVSFPTFRLHPDLIRGLEDSGYFRATKVQQSAIEGFEKGRPLLIGGPSGTGKTAAFTILTYQHLLDSYFKGDIHRNPGKGWLLGLVLTPSPELCEQVGREMNRIGRHIPLVVTTIVSSIKLEEDWEVLQETHIAVATPGIILKLIKKKKLRLLKLSALVIDEWDKITSDQGLSKDLRDILANQTPALSLRICSSATFSESAFTSLSKLMTFDWRIVRSDGVNENTKHFACRAGSFGKRLSLMLEFLRRVEFHQALIFCNIRQLSEEAERILNDSGFPTVFVSSQKDQRERLDLIAEFRDLQLRCLVTTDIEARGIDITNANLVISLDLPHDDETFLHRIGRVGRFMSDGLSLVFYKRSEGKRLTEIQQKCNMTLEHIDLYDFPTINLHLPALQSEIQIANCRKLRELQKEKSSGIPLMPFCDMRNPYWKTYSQISQQMSPPFINLDSVKDKRN